MNPTTWSFMLQGEQAPTLKTLHHPVCASIILVVLMKLVMLELSSKMQKEPGFFWIMVSLQLHHHVILLKPHLSMMR